MLSENKSRVISLLKQQKNAISQTVDAWRSIVYKGYMVVTAHWIDNPWKNKQGHTWFPTINNSAQQERRV